jgi:hypothetical protein
MANAKRDDNNVPTALGALETDGATIVPIVVNASNHSLTVDDNTTGTDYGPTNALRDDNNVPVLMAVSSADGVTPVVVYAKANGKILIDSN